jgi:glycosyltransferase involved in cell wall biosynthesis
VKIAFVASLGAPLCDVTSRGDNIVVADLARGLRDRGHEVMVFCAEGSHVAGVDTAPVARAGGYEQLFWHVAQWGPDVVSQHAADPDAVRLSAGVPAVHTMHANPTSTEMLSAALAAHAPIVTVSRDSERRWRDGGATNARAIPNGVPDFAILVAPPDPFALIAGRIAPEKGTAAALRAARRAGLEAVVVGDIADRAYFAREIVPLLDGVHVFRTLPRERVWGLMARAAVTLVPAEWDEPFGLVAAEAQLAGCPVAGYARGAISEVVTHGEGGVLAPPGDEDALVAAIPLARSLERIAVREAARERFDIELMLDAHEELLAEAATGMARDRPAA